MKKLFTTLALCLGLVLATSAQHCTPLGDSTTIPIHNDSIPGLSPKDSLLPCAVIGSAVHDTIYFKNFSTFSFGSATVTVNSLTIDSIKLPSGLCWVTNHANNTFVGGENGVIYVTGTPTAPPGQYKLKINIDAVLNNGAQNLHGSDAEAVGHLRYWVRVSCPGVACPMLNTQDTVDMYQPYNACVSGINELATDFSNVTVRPNPFSHATSLMFNSGVEGSYTVKMTNLLGAVVSSTEVPVVRGENTITQERGGLVAGIYLLSISNGQSSITKKVIIE